MCSLLRSFPCRPCVRCRCRLACGVVGSRGVGRPRRARSCGSACGLGWSSGRALVVVRGVARSGGSGRAGGSGRCRVRLGTCASSCLWAARGVVPPRGPLFRQIIPTNDPPACGQQKLTLPRDPACGQQQLDRCGGTNREEYLSAKGVWQSAAMPTIKALTKPQRHATGFGGSSHYTPRRKPAPATIGLICSDQWPERPAGWRAYGTDDHRRCWRLALHP